MKASVLSASLIACFVCGCGHVQRADRPLRLEGRTLDGKRYAVTGRDALLMCVMLNDAAHLRQLIAEGRDINTPFHGLHGSWTLLHLAVHHDHLEVARVLLENGASIRAKTTRGVTPLSIAQDNHEKRMIELFSKYGAK